MLSYPKPRKIASLQNLRDAWKWSSNSDRPRKSAGIDGITPSTFSRDFQRNLEIIRSRLVAGNYEFSRLRPNPIPKGRKGEYRIICIPTVEDRLVQRLLCNHLNQGDKLNILNNVSYGFIKGRGVGKAVRKAKNIRRDFPWVFKSDISSFFDQIDRVILVNGLERALGKSSVIPILHRAISCEVDDADPDTRQRVRKSGIQEGIGLRQGMPLSPLLSNFVLKKFDRHFERRKVRLIRYADDFVIFGKSEGDCWKYYNDTKNVLSEIGHEIPKVEENSKTIIREPNQPIDFLGLEITPNDKGIGYRINVPKAAFDEVKSRLQPFREFETAFHKYREFSRVIKKINNVIEGYINVYKMANNFNAFSDFAENCKLKTVRGLLISTFGKNIFSSLDAKRREFLGLPR